MGALGGSRARSAATSTTRLGPLGMGQIVQFHGCMCFVDKRVSKVLILFQHPYRFFEREFLERASSSSGIGRAPAFLAYHLERKFVPAPSERRWLLRRSCLKMLAGEGQFRGFFHSRTSIARVP